MWLVAEDKQVEYADEVYSMTESGCGKKLSLLCPTTKILSRGDTLNKSTLTIVSGISHDLRLQSIYWSCAGS